MCWTLKVDDYVMLRKIRKKVLVRLPRICPRHFLSFECFNITVLRSQKKPVRLRVLPLPVRLRVLHQQQMCGCKFL